MQRRVRLAGEVLADPAAAPRVAHIGTDYLVLVQVDGEEGRAALGLVVVELLQHVRVQHVAELAVVALLGHQVWVFPELFLEGTSGYGGKLLDYELGDVVAVCPVAVADEKHVRLVRDQVRQAEVPILVRF